MPKGSKSSRLETIRVLAESKGLDPEYQLPESSYLTSALSEVGEAKMTGERLSAIDWIDIKAWIDVTGAIMTVGECEALKTLSSIYVSQYYESMDSGCVSPNIEKPKNRDEIAGKIKGLFAMLRN